MNVQKTFILRRVPTGITKCTLPFPFFSPGKLDSINIRNSYKFQAICKSWNGESEKGMRGMMGTQEIRVGTRGIRVGIRRTGVGMLGLRGM